MNTVTDLLDWVKVQVRDKAGIFVLGVLMGATVVFPTYKSEERVKEYVEKENERLKKEVENCSESRKKDRDNFLKQMKELYHFQEQIKKGFQEAEHHSRALAEERKGTIKDLER